MKKLKLILVERGITQMKLAKAVMSSKRPKTAYTEINKLCNGRKFDVNLFMLRKICEYLDLTATDVLGF